MTKTRALLAVCASFLTMLVATTHAPARHRVTEASAIGLDRSSVDRASRSYYRALVEDTTTTPTIPPTTTTTRRSTTTTSAPRIRSTTTTTAVVVRPAPAPRPAAVGADPAAARALGQQMAADVGWTGAQWSCLDELWGQHESGWNVHDSNASGAYGIPQALPGSKMAASATPEHPDWRNDAWVQITWGFGYISGRYHTPCGALAHWRSVVPHWY